MSHRVFLQLIDKPQPRLSIHSLAVCIQAPIIFHHDFSAPALTKHSCLIHIHFFSRHCSVHICFSSHLALPFPATTNGCYFSALVKAAPGLSPLLQSLLLYQRSTLFQLTQKSRLSPPFLSFSKKIIDVSCQAACLVWEQLPISMGWGTQLSPHALLLKAFLPQIPRIAGQQLSLTVLLVLMVTISLLLCFTRLSIVLHLVPPGSSLGTAFLLCSDNTLHSGVKALSTAVTHKSR